MPSSGSGDRLRGVSVSMFVVGGMVAQSAPDRAAAVTWAGSVARLTRASVTRAGAQSWLSSRRFMPSISIAMKPPMTSRFRSAADRPLMPYW